MKNNINFILPKIAGLTLLAGVGAMILFLLFKVLIVALVVSVGIFAVKSAMMLINQAKQRLGYNEDEYSGHLGFNYQEQPLVAHYKRDQAIIPIR